MNLRPFSSGPAAGWRSLTAREKALLASHLPLQDLARARLYDGRVPWYLPARFAAVTRGHRVYFRPGACRTDTATGLALLAHELVHVGQYRRGATWLTFLLSYLRHGYWNSPLEAEARALAQKVLSGAVESEAPGPAGRAGVFR